MPVVAVFEQHAEQYDRWFEEHERLYMAEVAALQRFDPCGGLCAEIGVGTGRFAAPLGIKFGVEPSRQMARIARRRGIAVCQAVGEHLPFRDDGLDGVVLVTVICFVDDVNTLLQELRRVLKPGGRLVLGFIDRRSLMGRAYEARKETSTFYREARFYAADEVATMVRQAGFTGLAFSQTLLGPDVDHPGACDVREGYGEGAFVVVSAVKREA
jgi:SAM-dependent methyltransferase